VLGHGEVLEELWLVGDEGELLLGLDRVGDDVPAVDGDRAGRGSVDAGNPTISPASTRNEKSLTAVKSPYVFVSRATSIIGPKVNTEDCEGPLVAQRTLHDKVNR
jgi:hypothetical protein